jgi:hypothetical protein
VEERADVPPEDKTKIKQLLSSHSTHIYVDNHQLSEKARLVNEYTLRQHAEWTKNSEMIEIYTHELAGESSEDLLLAYGIDVKKKNAATATTINDKGENKAAEASSSSLYPRHARIAASQTSQPQNSASTVRWY